MDDLPLMSLSLTDDAKVPFLPMDNPPLFRHSALYEFVEDDQTEEEFDLNLDTLVERGFIRIRHIEDEVVYERRPGLLWNHLPSFPDLTAKQRNLIYSMCTSPKTKLFLYNTQKGKSSYTCQVLQDWTQSEKKIVAAVVLSNDQTLGDQTIEGALQSIGRPMEGKELSRGIFPLMSQYKVGVRDITAYCDAYRWDTDADYPMPIIFSLDNAAQRQKIGTVLEHIQKRYRAGRVESLNVAMVFDEGDSTYPAHRALVAPLLQQHEHLVHEIQWVTATDGSLMDDYDECRIALCVKQPEDPNNPYYRSIHHPSAIVRNIPHFNNRCLAEDILKENLEHFQEDVPTLGGSTIKRKTIVNGSHRGQDQVTFARRANTLGFHALTFNMNGVKLYSADGSGPIRYKTKKRRLNELLYYIYCIHQLEDRPLVIVGRRKVDRGLGFHYAPRSHQEVRPKILDFGAGPVQTDGIKGLIFTDEILGEVKDLSSAAQKSGRLDGVIGQCPQCPIHLTWWTDPQTGSKVIHHKKRVDATHTLPGYFTAEQGKQAATRLTRLPDEYTITETIYTDRSLAHAWAVGAMCWDRVVNSMGERIHGGNAPWDVNFHSDGMLYDHGPKPVSCWAVLDRSNLSRFGEGVRCIPVLTGTKIGYVISYKTGWLTVFKLSNFNPLNDVY